MQIVLIYHHWSILFNTLVTSECPFCDAFYGYCYNYVWCVYFHYYYCYHYYHFCCFYYWYYFHSLLFCCWFHFPFFVLPATYISFLCIVVTLTIYTSKWTGLNFARNLGNDLNYVDSSRLISIVGTWCWLHVVNSPVHFFLMNEMKLRLNDKFFKPIIALLTEGITQHQHPFNCSLTHWMILESHSPLINEWD